jgi:hypothetical protein
MVQLYCDIYTNKDEETGWTTICEGMHTFYFLEADSGERIPRTPKHYD